MKRLHVHCVLAGLGSMCIINNDDWSKMSRIGEEKITSMARNGGYVCSMAASGTLLALGCRSGNLLGEYQGLLSQCFFYHLFSVCACPISPLFSLFSAPPLKVQDNDVIVSELLVEYIY